MNAQQLAILQRNGSVTISDNGHGFSARVVRNGGRSRAADDLDDQIDPDDRGGRHPALSASSRDHVETDAEREERFAQARRVTASIESKLAKADAARIEELDAMLNRFQSYEARRLILMAKSNGFEFDLIMQKCCAFEAEEKKILNLLKEYRRTSLGLPSASNASRASRFLDDEDEHVRMFARMVSNRELLPGEKADQEAEAEPTQKKGKRGEGDRSGDKEDFKKAEEGEVSESGQSKADDIDAEMDKFYKSQGWK